MECKTQEGTKSCKVAKRLHALLCAEEFVRFMNVSTYYSRINLFLCKAKVVASLPGMQLAVTFIRPTYVCLLRQEDRTIKSELRH